MYLSEPVSIPLRIHVSFLLEELLHFRFGRLCPGSFSTFHFPLTRDLPDGDLVPPSPGVKSTAPPSP